MKKMHKAIICIIAIAAIAFSVYVAFFSEVHEHADFAVYINGQQLNFSQQQYMHDDVVNETGPMSLADKVHLHDMAGTIVHKHAADVTWGMFFSTINITFNSTCFAFNNASYCDNATGSLRMFVNGKQNFEYGNYPINDLDRVLITYGPVSADVEQEMANVTNDSCIYSNKCPDRGAAPPESCITGGPKCT